jgi:hypothetical protein
MMGVTAFILYRKTPAGGRERTGRLTQTIAFDGLGR